MRSAAASVLLLVLAGMLSAAEPAARVKEAVARALPLIQKGAAGHMEHRTCFACHHQALPLLALTTARSRGLAIDEEEVRKHREFIATFLAKNQENYRKGRGQGGQADTAGYALWALDVAGRPADELTAAVAEYLLQRDENQDHWKNTSNRPPSEASPFTTSYLAVRALQTFGTSEQQGRIGKRVEALRGWLTKATPKDTEDRVFRLWAVKRAGLDGKVIQSAAQELLKTQRDDGGWAQLEALSSDAYATGSALVALHDAAGLATDDPAYRRGVDFLLQTQREDGTWYVKSRSKPFQAYFESGFPHGKDQFISLAASSWAATALALALPPEPVSAEALRNLDVRVCKPGSDEAKQAPDLVWKYFKARRDQVNLDSPKWKFDTRPAWERLRDEKIANLKAYLGRFPDPSASLPVHVTRTIPGAGFVIENLVYESRPGLWVTANLYRPEPLPASLPGFVIVHSHHNPKTQGELQDMGMLWARAGCYVLVPDMLGHGERRQHPFHTEKDYPGPFKAGRQDYYFRYNSGLQLHLAGESLLGWMAWDLMRGVDLLLARPGTDPQRIGLLGSVAGGGDPAAVTAALDPRIALVAPFNFGGPQPETKFPLPDNAEEAFNYVGGGSWESTRNLRGSARGGFLPWVIVAAAAPRAIIHAHEFAWDRERDPAWRRYQQIMALYGAGDKLAFTHGRGSVKGTPPESTHCNNIGAEHRKLMHPAINRWFGIDAREYSQRLPADELRCWTPELRAKLQPRPLHELVAEWAARRQKEEQPRLEQTLAEWRKALAVPAKAEVRAVTRTGPVETAVLISAQGALPVPLTIIHPSGAADGELRVVVGVAQQGRAAFLKHRAAALAQLAGQGVTVVLADLPGTGETRSGDGRGRTSSATSVSSFAQMFGTTLLELRLQALAEVLSHVQRSAGGRKLKLALWGDSFAPPNDPGAELRVPYDAEPFPRLAEPLGGLLALLAPVVSDVPVSAAYAHGGLVSCRSVLESPFLYLPHDAVEPGLLAKFDLDEAARRFAPRPLRLEGLINGLNVVADAQTLRASYARAADAYRSSAGGLALQPQRSTDADVAAWLAGALRE